ncbi:MAG: helix-turn-helix domain-containing protein [Microthrixaceae bacterium]|nr:helix-turn-helix domain-containing protein [Microthrixaceae bacterium]
MTEVEQVERRTVSVTEAARILGISRAHAYHCVRSGELPAIVLGRRIVVPKAVLDRILGESAGADT